jgi:cytidyltransferase-like protein
VQTKRLSLEKKKVFVSGCFDLLHSGHIAFLETAATYGDLYVCIGSDNTVKDLKGRYPIITQQERKYMIQALRCIKECRINTGSGMIDFENELNDIEPDIFIVNEDGNTPSKASLCAQKGIDYIVLDRIPTAGLPVRSTTSLRTNSTIPFRIDLAGGWLDQPYVNKYYAGPVLTISIEPTIEFNNRSGMSSSTRNKAIELWKAQLPDGDPIMLSKVLFSYENPPGTKQIAGSQDAIGIVMPGLNKLFYNHDTYWPTQFEKVEEETILSWIENNLYLIPLDPRQEDYDVLANTRISTDGAKALAEAAEGCWQAIQSKDLIQFGKYFLDSFHAQIAMFPNMLDATTANMIEKYKAQSHGYKLSGAGGGGYLILVSDTPIDNAIQIKIRRRTLN